MLHPSNRGRVQESPLAEGRELKSYKWLYAAYVVSSPLAEGRELKLITRRIKRLSIPVAPRGGA